MKNLREKSLQIPNIDKKKKTYGKIQCRKKIWSGKKIHENYKYLSKTFAKYEMDETNVYGEY